MLSALLPKDFDQAFGPGCEFGETDAQRSDVNAVPARKRAVHLHERVNLLEQFGGDVA
jgi:hypothetical protein